MNDSDEKFKNLSEYASTQEREIVLGALRLGLNATLPQNLIKNNLQIDKSLDLIRIGDSDLKISDFSRIIIIGGGKATALMCYETWKICKDILPISGAINIPHGQEIPKEMNMNNFSVEITRSAHPIPDENGIKGIDKMFRIISDAPNNSLVLVLISGGGSALMTKPFPPLILENLQEVNKILLSCGASINEINTIRKHLDLFKGGRLAEKIFPRKAYSFILSDVIGDPLDIIASGPTVPDSSNFKDLFSIVDKYQIQSKIPSKVMEIIDQGVKGEIADTPKSDAKCFQTMKNLLIGSAKIAEETYEGFFEANNISKTRMETMQGEAIDYGKKLADQIFNFQLDDFQSHKSAYFTTGEFTVTLKGKGKGGRNQEMLLGFLTKECEFLIEENPNYQKFIENYSYCITACAFDGIEGNCPAMGAIIDSYSLGKLQSLLSIEKIEDLLAYLRKIGNNNDSFSTFEKLGDALIVGQTGTNVNDSLILLISKS